MAAIAVRPSKARRAALLALGLASFLGCGVEPGAEEQVPAAIATAASGRARASSMDGDLVATPAPVEVAAATAAPAVAAGTSGAADPKVIYLVYADGKTVIPQTSYNACTGAAPKFDCTFGTSLLDCEQQVQAYLDRWYADFNVIFTLTRPTSGTYYTQVVSSGGGSWCNVSDTVAGVAPLVCQDIHSGVAYTVDGGGSAHDTAVIIAHEQGHLLGLEHVTDPGEIMYPSICQTCDGFEDAAYTVSTDKCSRPTQNSYQMVMNALGPWGGGPKPSAFRCINDTAPPSVSFVSPTNGERMGHDFSVNVNASDDCDLADVTINVEPQGLSASAAKGPFQWDLTGIDGSQTITVTATDGAGHATVATLAVVAPPTGVVVAAPASMTSGCTVASGAFGAAGLVPSLAMLLVFAGRARRPARRRVVPGALAEAPRRSTPPQA